VPFWYRQNVLLYIRRDRLSADYTAPPILDVVHPELLNRYSAGRSEERYISGKQALSALVRSVTNRLTRRSTTITP
jgi:hypothetical protein